ncbi:MAG: NAD(P)H-quinone oxidoreductase [Anaerolineales bacterium]
MQAVIAQNQEPVLVDIPTPSPAEDEILVKVHASALNRADLMQVAGNYPVPPGAPETLGMELAGDVVEVGAGVTAFSAGDRVMALVEGGGYAQFATARAAQCMPIPEGMSYSQGAAIPEVFLTAYSNMVEIGGLLATDRVLIHAGASGVGLAAIQIAKIIGATVIVTASAAKHDICLQQGADAVIDYKSEDFAAVVAERYGGVNLIIDFIGAPYWQQNITALEKWGRLVFVGLMGGAEAQVNLGQIMRKRLTITGSTLRDRTPERKANLVGRFWLWAAPHFETGTLRPIIWREFPLDAVAAAHAAMRANQNAGKIILRIDH